MGFLCGGERRPGIACIKELGQRYAKALTQFYQRGNGRCGRFVQHGTKRRVGDAAFFCQAIYAPVPGGTQILDARDDLGFQQNTPFC